MRCKKKFYSFMISVLLILITLFSTSCAKEPIKIGMIGSLTSKQSQLAIDSRNAVELAVMQINENGGINGHPIQLIVKDDGASSEIALQKHQEFMDEGVSIVIGHLTSNMTDAVLQSQSPNLMFLSPSMSIEKLSNRNDFFLRTSPLANAQGDAFIDYIKPMGFKKIAVVYDTMNKDYTQALAEKVEDLSFANDIQVNLVPFDSRENNLTELVNTMKLDDVECVFMISQASDTAFISQKIKGLNDKITLFSVSWSMTKDLVFNGGSAVEDMYFVGILHPEEKSEMLQDFETQFEAKYNYKPSFISVMSYDATNILAEGLKRAKKPTPTDVRQSLIDIKQFSGLEENFEMNNYGDCNRGYLVYQLQNGEFVPMY